MVIPNLQWISVDTRCFPSEMFLEEGISSWMVKVALFELLWAVGK